MKREKNREREVIQNDSLARGHETVILYAPLIIPEFSNF